MNTHDLIPVLLMVLLVGLLAMLYSLWAGLYQAEEDTATIDLTELHPYSGRDWMRDDLP